MKTTNVVNKGSLKMYDVFGPTVRFLTSPEEVTADYCLMLGSIPPGVSVPLHCYPDDQSFYILSGVVQVLTSSKAGDLKWKEMKPGNFIHVPGNVKHAWLNKSDVPVEGIITTTRSLGKFFQEIGRLVAEGQYLPPPTPDELQHFMQLAAEP